MKNWSAYQLAVFENVAHGEGHTVVNAVAGSGKTTTIEAAVDYIPPRKQTLFVAFNKSIEEELSRRLSGKRGVQVSTLHSYGLRVVTANLGRLRIEKYRLDNLVEKMLGNDRETADIRRDLTKIVSLAKGTLAATAEEVDALVDQFGADSVNGNREQFVKDALTLLERCKDVSDGCVDFDDMIWLPVVLNLTQIRYDRVIGDEIQDFNAAQIELMLRALSPSGRFLGVGDPRQGIYRFRGADENAFARVKQRMDAVELPLSVSYRCCQSVVREAQTIVPYIEPAPGAVEGEVRLAPYQEMKRSVGPGDFVLSRSNAPLIALCMALLKEGRKANIQGRDVGVSLKAFVKKSKAQTVEALRDYVEEWKNKECLRLAAKRRDTQAVEDRAACLLALSEGARDIRAVVDNIDTLFADKDGSAQITLSSTHKAKGLERERVWVLASTYRKRDELEEDNLYYVAVTRAKLVLVLVDGLGKEQE